MKVWCGCGVEIITVVLEVRYGVWDIITLCVCTCHLEVFF